MFLMQVAMFNPWSGNEILLTHAATDGSHDTTKELKILHHTMKIKDLAQTNKYIYIYIYIYSYICVCVCVYIAKLQRKEHS